MTIIDCVQRSDEWYAARLGRVTSSVVADMLALRKDKTEAAGRRNLRIRLALERIVGRSLESDYVSAAMQTGIDREADALAMYEALTGRVLSTVGFVAHDTLQAGCSPDGIVGDCEGVVEVKAPLPATHLESLKTGTIPGDYFKQCTHHLWVTGARWCDWLSFCPEFPEPLRATLVRVTRDETAMAAHELNVSLFLSEVEREVETVLALAAQAAKGSYAEADADSEGARPDRQRDRRAGRGEGTTPTGGDQGHGEAQAAEAPAR